MHSVCPFPPNTSAGCSIPLCPSWGQSPRAPRRAWRSAPTAQPPSSSAPLHGHVWAQPWGHGAMGPRCHGAGAHLLLPPALHPAPVVQHGGSRRCGPDTAVPPCPPVCPPPGSLPLAHGVPPVPPPRPSRQEGSGPAPHIPGQPSGCGVPAGPPPALPAAPWGGGKAVGARRRGAAHQRAAVVIPTTPCPGHHRQLSSGPMETGDRSSVTKVTA